MATYLSSRSYIYSASRTRHSTHRTRAVPRIGPDVLGETRPEAGARFDPPAVMGQYNTDLEAKFLTVLEGIFRDAPAAKQRFEELAEQMGWGAALAELRHSPESFGSLTGRELLGLIRRDGQRDRAYNALPVAVQLARIYLASRRPLAPLPTFAPAAAQTEQTSLPLPAADAPLATAA